MVDHTHHGHTHVDAGHVQRERQQRDAHCEAEPS